MKNGIDEIIESYPHLKKAAFFHSHNLWNSHIETELELIDGLKKKQIQTISYTCDGDFSCCDLAIESNKQTCSNCIQRRNIGLLLVNEVKQIRLNLKKTDFKFDSTLDISQFIALKYKNFDVGYAVVSSIVFHFRDPYISIEQHYELFKKYTDDAIAAYEFFVESLSIENPDLVFIFNGRFAYTKALLRACEFLKIPFYTHERGSSIKKYMLFKNTMPHDLQNFHNSIIAAWDEKSIALSDKTKYASDFYEKRAKGNPEDWFSFVSEQDKQSLPKNWDPNKYNIAVFLSSEDEFFAVGDHWKRPLFSNQIIGLKFLFDHLQIDESAHYYIRMHPNSKSAIEFISQVQHFQRKDVTVLPPESPESTYNLLLNVDKVVTFGSTIGVEATYWKNPSINLDNAIYYHLDATYNPITYQDIVPLIEDRNLTPKEKTGALQYGYFMSTFGYEFQVYHPLHFGAGKFKGINLSKISSSKMPLGYKMKILVKKTLKLFTR